MGSVAPFSCSLEIVGHDYILPLPAWCAKIKMSLSCTGHNPQSDYDGFQAWLRVLCHLSHREVDSPGDSPLLDMDRPP